MKSSYFANETHYDFYNVWGCLYDICFDCIKGEVIYIRHEEKYYHVYFIELCNAQYKTGYPRELIEQFPGLSSE